jgi:hypothetical protein
LWLIDRIKYKIKSGQIVEDVFILNKEIRDERIFWEKKGFTGMIRTKFKIQGKTISFE